MSSPAPLWYPDFARVDEIPRYLRAYGHEVAWHDPLPGTVEYGACARCEGAYAITGRACPWIYVMELADTLVSRCTGEPTQPAMAARLTIGPAFGPWDVGAIPPVGSRPVSITVEEAELLLQPLVPWGEPTGPSLPWIELPEDYRQAG